MPLSFHWVGDMLLSEQLEEMAARQRRVAADARLGLLLQSRRVLVGGRADQGQEGPQRRPAGPAGRGTEAFRLDAGGRAEIAAAPAARRGRPSCRPAAQVPADRRGTLPAQAALHRRVHGDAFGGHQPAGPQRGAAQHHQGSAGEEEDAGGQRGAPDFRPRRPPAVRQAGLRLRPGPRGRRADRPLAGEIRPDSRGHEGPGPAAGARRPGAEAAQAPRLGAVLERGPVPEARRPRRPASSPAADRCPGGCWPTCSTPRRRSI